MRIKVKKLRSLGTWDSRYRVWRQTDAQEKRKDVDPSKLYLVLYSGTWLIGRFDMQWYGWNFRPNLGAMSVQIESLEVIYEISGLKQDKDGSTAAHIIEYLAEEEQTDDDD